MLDPKVFKAYDVRGIYGEELDEEGAYAIGRAYVEEFEPRKIAVGRDMRVHAPTMAAAVIEGAADGGADVVDIGMVGTEMLYLAVGHLSLDGGIMVTASHNPKEYTGMKVVRRGALPVGGDSGLLEVRDRALALKDVPKGQSLGHVRREDVYPAFVEHVLSFVDVSAIKPLRVVIDAANGMAGAMLPPVLERLPIDAVRCFFEPDGTFPNHEPNPLLPENREFIIRKTREEGADLGVAYDGDADRCFFVDDTGEFVAGDFVTALLAESILAKEGGGKVIYDVRASWAVPETIERAGGVPLDQPRRPRVHQAPDPRGGRGLRRRGVGALLLPRLLPGRLRRDPVPAHARADLEARAEALGDPRAVPVPLLHHRRDQHAGRRRRAQARGAEGALRARGHDLGPRRHLDRRRRLALQRPPVEHRAAAPPEPRGALAGADGTQARRGARRSFAREGARARDQRSATSSPAR